MSYDEFLGLAIVLGIAAICVSVFAVFGTWAGIAASGFAVVLIAVMSARGMR